MTPGKQAAQILHVLPKRIRLRAPALASHEAACRRVAQALLGAAQCDLVTIRPTTGSVLVEASTCSLDAEALCERLRVLVESERDEHGKPLVESIPEPTPGPTRIARAVASTARDLNEDMARALGFRADLRSLVPLLLATAGFAQFGLAKKVVPVPWFNLFYWSLRIYMLFNMDAVEEQTRPKASGMDPTGAPEAR